MKRSIIFLGLVILLSGYSFSQQVVGKIYTRQEADNLYGPVLSSVPVSSSVIAGCLKSSVNYVMFKPDKGTVYIANNSRQALSPAGYTVSSEDVFRVFSISLVAKLLQDGGSAITYIETRKDGVISINNGVYILEYGITCPPYCL